MDKNLARELLPVVTDPDIMGVLSLYVFDRINKLHLQLESVEEYREVQRIQGQIKEIKRLLTLKEEVMANAK